MNNTIFLIDIDGVLIKPGGYKRAMQDTCKYFLSKGGIEQYTPGEEVYACFESQRVTSEWDMVPLSLLIIIDTIAGNCMIPEGINELIGFMEWIKLNPIFVEEVPFRKSIREFGRFISPGKTAAQRILDASFSGQGVNLFANLPNRELITSILGDTRNQASPLVSKFQEYSLGGELFNKVYGRSPEAHLLSYLEKYDDVIISREYAGLLLTLMEKKEVFSAIYTARPSLPPKGIIEHDRYFSPEAELAAKQCGLEVLPLIGYGRLGYLANLTGKTIPDYVKPSSGQALAAMYAAWSGNELQGLLWAEKFIQSGSLGENFRLPSHFELYVFEDSAAGLQGAQSAIRMLQNCGVKVGFHPIGISSQPEKIEALNHMTNKIYPDINKAINDILESLY